MKRSNQKSQGPRIALLLAFVLAAFTSANAFASCGDYVVVGRSGPKSLAAQDRASVMVHTSSKSEDVPCSGPSCRDDFPIPTPSAPATTLLESVDHWAFLIAQIGVSEGGHSLNHDPCNPIPSEGYHLRIDRPPRSFAL